MQTWLQTFQDHPTLFHIDLQQTRLEAPFTSLVQLQPIMDK